MVCSLGGLFYFCSIFVNLLDIRLELLKIELHNCLFSKTIAKVCQIVDKWEVVSSEKPFY